MARIPTYQKDIHISDLDRIIGTDGDTNELVTKNFFLGDIAEYVIDKFIDPDAASFTIPVFRDTQDTLGSNATRITGSIMSQDINPDGTKITIAGLLQVDKEAKIKGKLTEGVAESGQLILNSSLNATGITIKAPAHANLPVSYTMELPNDIGSAGSQLTTDGIGKVYWADPEDDDLNFEGDVGDGTVDLDTQVFKILGGNAISTTALGDTITIAVNGQFALDENRIWIGDSNNIQAQSTTVSFDDDLGIYNFGTGNTTSVHRGFVFGENNTISDPNAFASGNTNTVTGSASAAFGSGNTVLNYNSFAGGYNNVVDSVAGQAFGWNNTVTGSAGAIFGDGEDDDPERGYFGIVAGAAGFGAGKLPIVEGTASIGLGYEPRTYGNFNTAIGSFTSARGRHNAALGYEAKLYPGFTYPDYGPDVEKSTAIGHAVVTSVVGETDIVEFALAAGDNAIAQYPSSTAIGKNALTSAAGQLALGGDSIRLNAYGAGTITGTEAYRLGVTSSGDIIEITDAGGNVTGTGTTQTLPVWSDGPNGALGDSPIKVVPATTGGTPTYADNLLIGDWNNTVALTSNRTLQVGNSNTVGSTSGRTARAIVVGESNQLTATTTQTQILNSTVIGNSNIVSASETLVVGKTNTVRGGNGFVAGVDNTTSERVARQFVIGRENTVDSVDTIVLGDRNTVTETGTGFGSMMVFGHLNNILGDRIVCLGTSNTANSDNQDTYLIGVANSSTADRTYTLGRQNSITANESFALGQTNTITGTQCVAVGVNNTLAGFDKSYAFGFGNDNVNFKSFAIGDNNDVLNTQRTYLIGRENQPNTDNTIILGQFSDPTVLRSNNTQGRSTVAFAVGSNSGIRRTAWEFRGKQTSAGATSAGDSMQVMAHALRYSTSYANDAEASTGGVEMGQLYRNGNDVKIRMSGDESSEATYLLPLNVTASPGGSSTLAAVDIATLVKISWSGVNGTYTLNLPPAADMQYRTVRFISDGAFGTGAGDKVLITPNGTETIDGASNFEISKSYEGVALWSDGTEWIIIQAKAH